MNLQVDESCDLDRTIIQFLQDHYADWVSEIIEDNGDIFCSDECAGREPEQVK